MLHFYPYIAFPAVFLILGASILLRLIVDYGQYEYNRE